MIYNVFTDENDNMIAFFERKKAKDEHQLCIFVEEKFKSLFVVNHEYEIPQDADTFSFEKDIGDCKQITARRANPEEVVIINLTRNNNEDS